MVRCLFDCHGDALPTSPGGDRTRELSEKGHGDISEWQGPGIDRLPADALNPQPIYPHDSDC